MFNIADSTVIVELHRPHRAVESKKFLFTTDNAAPRRARGLLICDTYAARNTPAIKALLSRNPR